MDIPPRAHLLPALRSPDPIAALSQIVREMKAAGKSQQEIYTSFSELLQVVQVSETEQEEDVIRDIMDFIAGWCSPGSRFFDTYLET